MDYEKLANLLYPNVNLTVEDCLKLYPQRNLPLGAEVMRFAPSPTGFFHIGGLYSALISKLETERTGGVFYLRIEDTDTKREIKGAGNIICESLKLFGINPDEGYNGENFTEIGEYGPYVQSKRINLYHAFAKELVKRGRAFPCFCEKTESKQDVLDKRKELLEQEEELCNKDVCRNLTYEQIEQNIKQNKPFALRLLSIGDSNKSFNFFDNAKGNREIRENENDIVLVKSNGIPPYSLAHIVDDTLMGTTTVVRGEEWWPSLAAHLEIFKALNLKAPKYTHTPVACKIDEETGNKRKLSKRKDPESDVRFYFKNGYPTTAVVEYLLNLLNSDFEQWRTKNPTLSYKEFPFSIKKVGGNNPMYDIVKLNDYSKNYISKLDANTLCNNLMEYSKEFDSEFYNYINSNKEYVINVLNIDRDCPNPRKDIISYGQIKDYFNYMFQNFDHNNLSFYELSEIDSEKIKNVLGEYKNIYSDLDDKQTWFEKIKTLCNSLNYATDNKLYKLNPENYNGNTSTVCTYIRIAVTGKKNSPDLYSICKLLGKQEVINRLLKLSNLIG